MSANGSVIDHGARGRRLGHHHWLVTGCQFFRRRKYKDDFCKSTYEIPRNNLGNPKLLTADIGRT